MATSTLVVGFSEFQVSSFVQLVAARGIDRVIVVGSNADFSSSSQIAGVVSQASSVQSAGVEVQLAQGSSEAALSLTQSNFQAIKASGLEFLNDPGLSSFSESSTYILPSGSIAASGTSALFSTFDFDSLTSNDLGQDSAGTEISVPSTFSLKSTVSTSGGNFSNSNKLSDFSGSIKVNLTAEEFKDYLDNNFDTTGIESTSNIAFTEDLSTSAISSSSGLVRISVSEFNTLSSKVENHSSYSANQDSPSSNSSRNYRFSTTGSISASQALLLPDMGIMPEKGDTVALSDTSANLSYVLPKLTLGQLSSFTEIVTTDGGEIALDADTLGRLNSARGLTSWAGNRGGVSVRDASGNEFSLTAVAESISDLVDAGVINSETGSDGLSRLNLSAVKADMRSGSDLQTAALMVEAGLDISGTITNQTVSLTEANYIETILGDNDTGSTVSAGEGLTLNDTPANIKAALLSGSSVLSIFSKVQSTNSPAAIEVSYSQYLEIAGINESTTFTASTLSTAGFNLNGISFENVEFVVSGTASEINTLFSLFGSNLSGLADGVTFRVTDGGELTVNAAELDKLSGRIYGTVNVVDSNSGIATLLDGAIPDYVKDIFVDDTSATTASTLTLTVDQFRNLPAYADGDSIVIADSESNVVRALGYGVLNDRVTSIDITESSSDSDNKLRGGISSPKSSLLKSFFCSETA